MSQTIIEKAKRYDEIIEELKGLLECVREDKREILEEDITSIFPELQENEDEKIRKELIFYLGDMPEDTELRNGITNRDVLAWLEKQGEQKLNGTFVNIDAGYEWDAEKKQLRTIECDKPNFCHHEVDLSNCSEEYRKAYYDGWNNCNQQYSQLKAEQTFIWSEDDDIMLHNIIDYFENRTVTLPYHVWTYIPWLKSLRNKINCKTNWSEEDEKKRNLLIDILNVNHPNGAFKVNPANTLNMEAMSTEELIGWLKSLRPQNTWKPNDAQMIALNDVITNRHLTNANEKILKDLQEQLKKLKGE